jgi:hypothetical protein
VKDADPEIEITPKMIAAGEWLLLVLSEFT